MGWGMLWGQVTDAFGWVMMFLSLLTSWPPQDHYKALLTKKVFLTEHTWTQKASTGLKHLARYWQSRCIKMNWPCTHMRLKGLLESPAESRRKRCNVFSHLGGPLADLLEIPWHSSIWSFTKNSPLEAPRLAHNRFPSRSAERLTRRSPGDF